MGRKSSRCTSLPVETSSLCMICQLFCMYDRIAPVRGLPLLGANAMCYIMSERKFDHDCSVFISVYFYNTLITEGNLSGGLGKSMFKAVCPCK